MKLFTIWDNTPANDNADPILRAGERADAVAPARSVGCGHVALDARSGAGFDVVVLAFRAATNDCLPAVLCKKPVTT
jgi:hypothetical protein